MIDNELKQKMAELDKIESHMKDLKQVWCVMSNEVSTLKKAQEYGKTDMPQIFVSLNYNCGKYTDIRIYSAEEAWKQFSKEEFEDIEYFPDNHCVYGFASYESHVSGLFTSIKQVRKLIDLNEDCLFDNDLETFLQLAKNTKHEVKLSDNSERCSSFMLVLGRNFLHKYGKDIPKEWIDAAVIDKRYT